MKIHSYKELIVWQKSIELVKLVAEGYARRSHKEYLQFYSISYGSALEVETQLIIAKKLNFADITKFTKAESLLEEVVKMLYVMVYRERRSFISV